MSRIEIVHWHDRDEPCGITVFLDGVEIEADIYHAVPKKGHQRSDWDEATDFMCSMASPAVAAVLRDARDDAANESSYIQEENGHEHRD